MLFRSDCHSVVCFKCRKMGHMSGGCRNPIVCTVCLGAGHSFKNCPAVKALGDITLGTKWTETAIVNSESSDFTAEDLGNNLENKGACGFNSNLINDGHVRSKVSSEVKQGYGYVKQHEPMDKTPSEVLVGPKVNSGNDGNTITTPFSITPSDDELFDAANMSKQRASYVSETDSDTESGRTTLDLANQHENREVNCIQSSQDLFSSQGSQNDLARHKRSRSLDR